MGLLDDKIEVFLKHSIEEEWGDAFSSGWKYSSFNKYTQNEDAVWNVIKTTVERAANKFKVPLDDSDSDQLRGQINLMFTPIQVIPMISVHLSQYVRRGNQCPPGTTLVLKARQLTDGTIVYDWVCE
jgi:hypothetical protein